MTRLFSWLGDFSMFVAETTRLIFTPPARLRMTLAQMYLLGVQSLPIITITSIFTGMVLALQTAVQIKKFGADIFVGGIVGISITRELGPVLTALMLAGRVGSGIAAELGTMRVTEQIDAMQTLGTNPLHYLAVPRILACVLMAPVLTVYFDFIGNLGSYLISVFKLGISSHVYIDNMDFIVATNDIMTGLLKAFVFGFIVAQVGVFYGFRCEGGAAGVGSATIRSVVISSMLIFVMDYFLSNLLYLA